MAKARKVGKRVGSRTKVKIATKLGPNASVLAMGHAQRGVIASTRGLRGY